MLNRIIFIIFVFVFISCDINNEAVPISDLGQNNLKTRLFSLNLEASDTSHISNPIGESSLLYSGPINDSDYVYTLLSINREIFQNYDLCGTDSISYKDLHMVVDVMNEYVINFDIQDDLSGSINQTGDSWNNFFLAYWIDFSDLNIDGSNIIDEDWMESDIKMFDDVNFNSLIESFDSDSLKKLSVHKYLGKYYIDLSSNLILSDQECSNLEESDCVDECIWAKEECIKLASIDICDLIDDSSQLLLIASDPNSKILYEFASSEYINNYSNTEPYLNIVYDQYEELNKQSNKFILSGVSNKIGASLYISDTLLSNYNHLFLSNFSEQDLLIDSDEIVDSLIWSNYNCNNEDGICINPLVLIDANDAAQADTLMNLEIQLVNVENFNLGGISFWLDNIKYLEYDDDPNNDNWIDENQNNQWDLGEGTENNMIYDDDEFYQDYGSDQCPNIYEDGENGCLCSYPFDDCDDTSSIYNPNGTENNNQFDLGEYYEDLGTDGCPDEYESGEFNEDTGIGICVCEFPDNCEINDMVSDVNDANQDNYNIDPHLDDWVDDNEDGISDEGEGTENNNKWDCTNPSEEECELFLDFGLDGLSEDIVGYRDEDGTEGNGTYDFHDLNGDGAQQSNEQLGEIYFDYGIDGIINEDEVGYNNEGSENNGQWENGEPYDDCGMDGICDEDMSDNFNIDPNEDFWLDCGSDHICPSDTDYINADENGTEDNSICDIAFCSDDNFSNETECINSGSQWYEAEYSEGNNIWNQGEFYNDYGTDQIKDEDELFLLDQKIIVSDTDTTYFNYVDKEVSYSSYLNQENDSLKIWISSIAERDNDILDIEISFISTSPITGIEFRLNHDIHSVDTFDWDEKTRNVAKVDNESYIKDISIFNNSNIPNSNSLYMNYAYGISSILNFNGFNGFIDTAKSNGYIINESNSYIKFYLKKHVSDGNENINENLNFYLRSNDYIINFNELDSLDSKLLFSYFVQNNPDSLLIPIGNLIQNYINNISNYNDGILINLGSNNQNSPIFNFNNIIIDTLRPPILNLYYFE